MWNTPNKNELDKIPRLYETENTKPSDKKIHLHFFISGSDWYISEYDGEDTFFGFAILNGMTDYAEWGYISFKELRELKTSFMQVDTDKHWTKRKAVEVQKIAEAGGAW